MNNKELQAYHSHPAWSSTKIKAAAKGTMRAFWAAHVDPMRKPFEPTEAMRCGSLCDALITCTPAEFQSRYVVVPDDAPKRPTATQLNAKKPSLATLDAIRWWEDFEAEAADREVITAAMHAHALNVAEALNADDTCGPILRAGRLDTDPFYWATEGREHRYMPDLETEDGMLIDLKITRSANPHHFKAQSYQLGYDIQMAHYEDGYVAKRGRPPSGIAILAYEWKWPHDCCLFVVPREVVDHGHERRIAAIEAVEACERSGIWPSHGERVLALPGYVKYDNEAFSSDPNDLDLEGLT